MNHTRTKRISGVMLIAFLVFCLPFFASAGEEPEGFTIPPVEAFILKWQKSGGYESGASQMFITELCLLLGVPKPDAPRAELSDNSYVFEKAVERVSPQGRKSTARIDLYLKGRLIWESKQGIHAPGPDSKGEPLRSGHGTRGTAAYNRALDSARRQAFDYAPLLPEGEKFPPFVIVADIGYSIDVYADFHGTGEYLPFPSARDNRITLEEIRKPEVQTLLRTIWTDPLSLDPSREREKVTKDIALKLSALAKSLGKSGHDPDTASLFLQRCIFIMFAEDCGLLPHGAFTALLERMQATPDAFAPAMTALWQTMQTGGESATLGAKVMQFKGYLFESAQALPLDKDQIALLYEAAGVNWAAVETSIFGTLLEQALSPQERSKLGAHYTPTAYVERLVIPTIIDVERGLWEHAKDAAMTKILEGDSKAAITEINLYYKHLTQITVLDPSCGSGNFLAVSLNLLKDLEGEVVQALRTLGLSEREIRKLGYSVRPHQMRGIEIVQRGADISELVLWIAYLQRHYKIHGNITPPEPVFQPGRSVECRDAVLAFDDKKKPIPAAPWPAATYIVGNPPYVGNKGMRQALGDTYVDALRSAYAGLPESIDYVMYWWHRAAQLARAGEVQRFGLITTNKIRQTFNRKVVERHVNAEPGLNILFAIPDHPWYDSRQGGAEVRVAMTVCGMEQRQGELAEVILERKDGDHIKVNFDYLRGRINTNLTVDVDATKLARLRANERLSWRGVTVVGKGFIVTPEQAKSLGLGRIAGLEKHIRPYMNGNDLAKTSRNVMIIDLYGLKIEEVQHRFPEVYAWIVDKVKPERDQKRDNSRRKNWWIFGRTGEGYRNATAGLRQYIATPQTSRRFFFSFLDTAIIPDDKLVVFAFDDVYSLGILSSKIHKAWTLATGGRLGVGNDLVYIKTVCFDAFPFPNANEEQKARIRAIAEAIDTHRKQRQEQYPRLTLFNMYAVMEQLYYGVNLKPKETAISEQGDIPALLKLHAELDAAVADAYGWPANLTTDEILTRLLELNQQRAEEESKGTIRWLRPEFQR